LFAIPPAGALSLNRLLAVYVPLALSWLMMAADLPICTAFVNLLPDHLVQIAALQALFAIALFVESPVIDLLATSTTLAKTKQSFEAIRKFTVWLMVWCGVAHFLVSATPLFDVVFRQILALPADIAEAVRLPMLILVPWSPAIGWRRHVQGLLIRNGETRTIGLGTLVRVVTIFVVALVGYLSHALPGAVVAAFALTSSVLVEAVFIHFAGKRALRSAVWPEGEPLRKKELWAFHLPLSVSTMVMLASMPLTTWSLAQAPSPLLAMNSWQISLGLAFLLRTVTFALPEVVIANWRPGNDARLLFRFCVGIGVGLSLLMVVMGGLGLDEAFFRYVMQADPDVARGAHLAFFACALLPVMTAATSYLKGVLTLLKVTVARLAATVASIVVLVIVLAIGVNGRWPGVYTAAMAVTLSQFAELLVLILLLRTHTGKSAFLAKQHERTA